MSDDQKKQDGKQGSGSLPGLGGGLPGIGGKPAGGLPGLGGKPGGGLPGVGGGGLPGVGGGGGLPGVGGGGGLPGLSGGGGLPGQQPAEPAAPAVDTSRDPFAIAPAPAAGAASRPSYMPDAGLISASADPSVSFSDADAGKSKMPLIAGCAILVLIALIIGFMANKAMAGRAVLNIAIRDALIIKYEIQKAVELSSEVQSVISTAYSKAGKHEYDEGHMTFLAANVKGNPITPRLFTERNYKNFEFAAVKALTDYYIAWNDLYKKIETHRKSTRNDKESIKEAKKSVQKLIAANYGVIFKRDKKANDKLVAMPVLLGATEEDGDALMVQVQAAGGTFADKRELYSPAVDTPRVSKDEEAFHNVAHDKYVIEIGAQAKAGLLKNASLSQFEAYHVRLKEITDDLSAMDEMQTNLMNSLTKICSQDPVSFGGIDALEEFEEYKKKDSASATAAPAAQ